VSGLNLIISRIAKIVKHSWFILIAIWAMSFHRSHLPPAVSASILVKVTSGAFPWLRLLLLLMLLSCLAHVYVLYNVIHKVLSSLTISGLGRSMTLR